MSSKKVYVVTDLGPGDGGKGGVVHRVATLRRAHTIIKVGGAQGSHGVRTARGRSFAFSQWGCGTFEGIRTHITPRIVVSPVGLINEANALEYEEGIDDPFALMTIDRDALCATPYHGIASQLKELSRGNNPRGTIGTGVGETYRDARRFPGLAIYVRDLSRQDLRDLIVAVRDQMIRDLRPIIQSEMLAEDRPFFEENVALLNDPGLIDYTVDVFRQVAKRANVVDQDYFAREVLGRDGYTVVESSHGILTDNRYGFHPHTSAIRTLPGFARQMLMDAHYDGDIVDLGVHRGYEIRHGAGPMPTADAQMGEALLPGSNKDENRWQGKVRVGPLDLNLMRYAIAASGGTQAYHGLAITWFDQVRLNGEWQVCNRYHDTSDRRFFTPEGELRFRHFDSDTEQMNYQEALTQHLFSCEPVVESIPISKHATDDELFDLCANVIHDRLGIPVRMLSLGPTEREKVCK